MIKIYVDGSFSWEANLHSKKKVGKIAYKFGKRKTTVKKIKIPEISGLEQYINIFELLAVLEAIRKTKSTKIQLFTDSQVIYSWVKTGKNLYRFSDIHGRIGEEIQGRLSKLKYSTINLVGREQNLAGKALEKLINDGETFQTQKFHLEKLQKYSFQHSLFPSQ